MSTRQQLPLTSSSGSKPTHHHQQIIQELTYTIELKQKKILYLQQQLRSTKDQSIRKLSLIQSDYDKLKKQHQSLHMKTIQQKQQMTKEWIQKIKYINQKSRQNDTQKELFYQNLFRQKEIQSLQLLTQFESRYQNIIKQLKQQNQYMQNALLNKQSTHHLGVKNSSNVMTFGHEQYQSLLFHENVHNHQNQTLHQQNQNKIQIMKEKLSSMQELFTYKHKCQKLTKQLQQLNNMNTKLSTQIIQKTRQYEQKISVLKITIQKFQQKVKTQQESKNHEISKFQQKIIDLQEQNQQLKTHLKQSDDSYLKLLQAKITQQAPQPLTTIKSCNHAGLISQMETSLQLKNHEIETLKEKLIEWERMFGFDKNIDQRLHDLGNISDRTQQVYKNQKQRLSSGTERLNRKIVKDNK